MRFLNGLDNISGPKAGALIEVVDYGSCRKLFLKLNFYQVALLLEARKPARRVSSTKNFIYIFFLINRIGIFVVKIVHKTKPFGHETFSGPLRKTRHALTAVKREKFAKFKQSASMLRLLFLLF